VADGSIVVPADGTIVAGGDTDNVTIRGATLNAGTYTGTSGKLAIDDTDGGEIEVNNGGTIEIAGGGNLEFTVAATSVIFNENSSLYVKADTGLFGEADQTDTKVSVTGASEGTATVVESADAEWTITDADPGTGDEIEVILGKLKLALTGSSGITDVAGEDADTEAAPGKLIAGPGTTITFAGTGP
jgi:hypothetical protein